MDFGFTEEQEAVRHEDYWDPEGWPNIARSMYPRMDETTRAEVEAASGRYLDLRHAFGAGRRSCSDE